MGDPLGAQFASIDAEFAFNTARIPRDSPEYRRQQVIAGQKRAEAQYGFGFGAMVTGIGLMGSITATEYGLERNTIGAQAAGIAASASQEALSLAMSGQGLNARLAMAAGNKQLDLLSREYALSFRAEAFDAQNMLINNPRDAQNPENIFGSIEAQREKLNGISLDKKDINEKAMAEAIQQAMFDGKLRDEIKAAVEDLLAK